MQANWVMEQTWHDLLFAHWPVPAEEMRRLVPTPLEVETFGGQAWIGVAPFRMTGIRLRGLPAMPGVSAFPELNVRTYVTLGGRSGVWFFSLDAASRVAVQAARRWYHLPYYHARMSVNEAEGWVRYESRRTHRGAPGAEFRGRYRPIGEVFEAREGSLEDWLTSRYRLYAIDRRGGVWRGDIEHLPWPLQPAEAEIERNTMTEGLGVRVEGARPLLHFARRLEVRIGGPERVVEGRRGVEIGFVL